MFLPSGCSSSGQYCIFLLSSIQVHSATEQEGEECKTKLRLVLKRCFCSSTQEEEDIEIKEGIVSIYSVNIAKQTFKKQNIVLLLVYE